MNANSSKKSIKQWLEGATARLAEAGIGTARLDCLILLEDILGKDRALLLANPEYPISPKFVNHLELQISRRINHEPLAYIRGFTEFYGRRFMLNKDVLEPRPESEDMIELLKDLVKSQKLKVQSKLRIADVGTGSGALAITAALEIPAAALLATDIDPKCLKVAKANAKEHKTMIDFYHGDLLSPVPSLQSPTFVLANLPYVPNSYTINQAAAMEPKIAIFGGPDGLDIYRRLFSVFSAPLPLFILTESLPPQHQKLVSIASKAGYRLVKTEGFVQVFAPVLT